MSGKKRSMADHARRGRERKENRKANAWRNTSGSTPRAFIHSANTGRAVIQQQR